MLWLPHRVRSTLISAAVLCGTFAADAGAQAPVDQPADWTWSAYGSGIGASNLHISTAGGAVEIVAGAGSVGSRPNRHWMILRYDAATQRYQQQFSSSEYPEASGPRSIQIADVRPDPGPEILVGRADGSVDIWNQQNRTLLATLATGFGLRCIAVADVDVDGADELLVSNGFDLKAYDLQGQLQWTAPRGGNDIVAAQMDADPALEIALTSGVVVDGATHQIQWTWNQRFGIDIEAADIDGDGMAELIVAEDWALVWCYDVDLQVPKWSIPIADLDCLAVGDIDSDGTIEIIVGGGQNSGVVCFDSATQQQEWLVPTPEGGSTDVTYGDTDGDGTPELVWGTGYSSSGPDYLHVTDWATQQAEWTSLFVATTFFGPEFGDFDGDGSFEMIAAAAVSDGFRLAGRLLVFDASTLRLFDDAPAATRGSADCQALHATDLDGDGDSELVVFANYEVIAYDYARATGFTELWSFTPNGVNGGVRTIATRDLDGDGAPEILLGTYQDLDIWDGATRQRLWRSFFLGRVDQVRAQDIDLDGTLELLARSDNGSVYAFDSVTFQPEVVFQPSVPGESFTCIHTVGASPLLITGDSNGGILGHVRQGGGYGVVGPLPVAAAAIDNILEVPGTPWFLIAADGSLRIHDGLPTAWSSRDFGSGFGRRVVLHPTLPMVFSASDKRLLGFRPVF